MHTNTCLKTTHNSWRQPKQQFQTRALALSVTLAFAAAPALATEDNNTPAQQSDERFQVLDDGKAVLDTQTNLVWARCVEGMVWDGSTCQGEAKKLGLRDAEKRWKSSAGGWRIPTLEELKSITKEFELPAIDTVAFPNTPPIGVWTSTAYARTEDRAQYISYANGSEYFDYRSEPHAIRLVRAK